MLCPTRLSTLLCNGGETVILKEGDQGDFLPEGTRAVYHWVSGRINITRSKGTGQWGSPGWKNDDGVPLYCGSGRIEILDLPHEEILECIW
jgi:hypothetical protein